jgi:GNAT superfamily N-acetyltransferase
MIYTYICKEIDDMDMSKRIETEFGYADIVEDSDDFGDHIRLDLVYVAPEYRGQGKGRELVKLASDYMKGYKGDKLLVVCPKDKTTTQDGLIDLYTSCGWDIDEDRCQGPLVVMYL